ncbi:hypothetical protein BpHYR1_014859 [Brachionus plicatilis]|uniref:Uncharacterized protein n=1 Tax=Brachionus plicatilis TaxID=10195 RepID=A0A3M7Q6A1_BRAPC|nr:hypothetical protein BpHYR1_014859 [Brachionus plicatilis]
MIKSGAIWLTGRTKLAVRAGHLRRAHHHLAGKRQISALLHRFKKRVHLTLAHVAKTHARRELIKVLLKHAEHVALLFVIVARRLLGTRQQTIADFVTCHAHHRLNELRILKHVLKIGHLAAATHSRIFKAALI